MISTNTSNHKLIKMALNGEELSFKILLKRHYLFVNSVVRKFVNNEHDIEELVQDTFCKAFQKLASFKSSAKFTTWLYTIARNVSLNFVTNRDRKSNLRKEFDKTLAPDYKQQTSPKAYQNIDQEFVRKMLNSLSPEDNKILTLYYIDDQSVDMIKNLTGISDNTIKVRLHRARKRLKVKFVAYRYLHLQMTG